LAAVGIGILVFVVGQAVGGPAPPGATPQLHAPVSLGGAPHVPVPSLPRVSVPSVPRVSVPSAPSLSTAPRSASGATRQTLARVGGTRALSSSSAGSTRASAGGRGGSARSTRGGRTRTASHAHRRRAEAAHDRRLRRDVTRLAGCLD